MGRACSIYEREERRVQNFDGKTWGKMDHLEDPGVDEGIILRWFFRKWDVRAWNGLSVLRIGTGGWHL